MKRAGRWLAGSLGALVLVVVGVIRFVAHPDVGGLVGGLAAAVVIIGVVVLVMMLPAALALRVARRNADGPVCLAVGDHSVPAAVREWRTAERGEVLRSYTYFVLELTERGIGVWEGGAAAVRVALIPADAILSVTREYGPFRTTSP
ncbi:hypothetical protein [Herbiconiux sp. UC225_62]|uniref:hypothetical protein n=1 Tax=Herbiconiux sp. UC225_62 TaxID=3350168 RepID=UPI0036D32230